jgi:hypothetical protein
MSKECIPGLILIYSCHKHKDTRLKEFGLQQKSYCGWKVFTIIGDPFLETEYTLEPTTHRIIIKCEDSYFHILKKVVLAIKVLLGIYIITEGVLRCGDDLCFNEQKLEEFLKNHNKSDFIGNVNNDLINISKVRNTFMIQYFWSHPEDLENPLNCIPYTLQEIQKFNEIPSCSHVGGVIFYISLHSCNTLIKHMDLINWDVFTHDNEYGYPYIIEDIGVGFILNINKIYPTNYKLYTDYPLEMQCTTAIGYHTNAYK